MDVISFHKKRFRCPQGVGLLLLAHALAGCAFPASAPARSNIPSEEQSTEQLPLRTIIYLQHPTAENKSLFAAITGACNCHPAFIRPYLGEALIYEIALPRGETFAAFEKALMLNATQLGIKAVEQDSFMQHE